MVKNVVCLKVPKKQGEQAIDLAIKLGLIDNTLSISSEVDWLGIPLLRQPNDEEIGKLRSNMPSLAVATSSFEEKKQPTKTLIQTLRTLQDKFPPELLLTVPQAFDTIGDIVIIEIPQQLKPYQNLIGGAILHTYKNIKTVLAKAGDISGIYRIRNYIFIAGEQRTNTVHREFGCVYNVDVAKAYFSPRLSHEHMRVASQVKDSEVVVDLFAGIGPFSVLIDKKQPNAKVYAVDLNPEAIDLLKVNIKINKLDNVFPFCADASEITKGKLKGVADRVIMNLPETAIDFVDAACNAIKPSGGVIHFYGFVRLPDTIENLQQSFSDKVKQNNRTVEEFLFAKSVRETAPYESQIVLDVKIK